MTKAVLAVALLLSTASSASDLAYPIQLIWPNAKVTAMAGAGVGLDGASGAVSLNPAGLATCTKPGGGLSYGQWLPGLFPGMHFWNALVHVPLRTGVPATVGVDVTLLDHGYPPSPIYEPPDSRVWRGAFSLRGGVEVIPGVLAAGLGLKALHYEQRLLWMWQSMPELGLSSYSSGTSFAVDAGLIWRAVPSLNVGAAVANLGPDYQPPGNHNPIPMGSVARVGLCWTAVDQRFLSLRVLPEVAKLLPSVSPDTLADPTFVRRLGREWRNTWRSFAVEASVLQVLLVRVGYLEDLMWTRGGFTVERDGLYEQVGLCDVLTRRELGRVTRIGLCWGVGFSLLGTASLDFGSDAAVYDFPTRNWKLSLTVHDPRGFIDLWRGEDSRHPAG
jgi:hypothetical protein